MDDESLVFLFIFLYSFTMNEIPFWLPFDGIKIPNNAVVGGVYKGEKAYIGRASHNSALMPGTVINSEKICLIPWVIEFYRELVIVR